MQRSVDTAKVLDDIHNERNRQQVDEGMSTVSDDRYVGNELARAAASYCLGETDVSHKLWPWATRWWRPTNRRRNLIKAGALIVAEIERLDRIERRKNNLL